MATKRYVQASVLYDTEGNLIPQVIWVDDVEYGVDRIHAVQMASSLKVGGVGVRYLISISNDELEIHNKKCHLWHERGLEKELWFVVQD